jgi:hypothetical protein
VKGPYRIPPHAAGPARPAAAVEAESDEKKFFDRPCYEFNRTLRPTANDRYCEHCRHYLTARCPHIDEFLDDVEDLTPE